MEIPIGGTRPVLPDFMKDSWLDVPEPDFSEVHNGFRYESISMKREFHGPESIELPDGRRIKISP